MTNEQARNQAIAAGKKYTKDSLQGVGAIAGKPCQIQSIVDTVGGHRVTFLWVDNSDVEHTSVMDVRDGAQGEQGETGNGIYSMRVATDLNGDNHLYVIYTEDTSTEIDLGVITATVPVASVNKLGKVKPDGTTIEIDPDGTIHGASQFTFDTNDFTNDSGDVSLNVSQRTFTGTQADWEALTTEEKKTYGTVNITDDENGSLEYYSTTETKTNKVWINGKPIYRKVISGDAAFSNTNWTNITISSDGVTKNVTDWKMLMAASSFRPRDFTITDVFSLSTASSEGNGNTVSGIFTLIIEYTKEG